MKKENVIKNNIKEQKKIEFAKCKTPEELEKAMHKYRSYDMLTVKDLINYLKKQNPNACILGFEPNSNAWIEQFKKLPSPQIRTVKEEKVREKESLKGWFRGDPNLNKKVEDEMKTIFRYAEDDDIIIRF